MIPPVSFVSSVYCASPSLELRDVVREHRLQQLERLRPLDLELAHVRDVEDAGVGAHGAVLGDHALVLHRHLPAGERNEPRAGGDVPVVERRAPEGLQARDANEACIVRAAELSARGWCNRTVARPDTAAR